MITDIDIKKQKIINLERSITLHILNKSPIKKIQEIRYRIVELKNEINREETDYYCAFDKAIGYSGWKVFKEKQFEQIKKMNEEDIAFMCGVNPNILSPDHKEDDELIEQIGKPGGNITTYAKDEGTLEGLQKLWKAIYKEKRLKKEKRMKTFILRRKEFECGEWVYNKVKFKDIAHFYTPAKIGSEVLLKGRKIWKIFKILDQKKRPITLILRNKETGKHHKVKLTKKNTPNLERFSRHIKEGDDWQYIPKGGIDWESCVVVKILEAKKKRKEKSKFPKGAIFSEFANWELPDSNTINMILESLKQTPGVVIEFQSTPIGKNYVYGLYEEIKKEKEKKSQEKKALSEFRKRPYFKTIVEEVKGKPRGEENLEKIKFPCYCTHNAKTDGYSGYGMIITSLGITVNEEYTLVDIGKQRNKLTTVASNDSLERLIEIWDIEILKGELKLYKEVGEYTKKKE